MAFELSNVQITKVRTMEVLLCFVLKKTNRKEYTMSRMNVLYKLKDKNVTKLYFNWLYELF